MEVLNPGAFNGAVEGFLPKSLLQLRLSIEVTVPNTAKSKGLLDSAGRGSITSEGIETAWSDC